MADESMGDQSEQMSNFMAVTSADSDTARFHLEASGWDLGTAISQFFAGPHKGHCREFDGAA